MQNILGIINNLNSNGSRFIFFMKKDFFDPFEFGKCVAKSNYVWIKNSKQDEEHYQVFISRQPINTNFPNPLIDIQ